MPSQRHKYKRKIYNLYEHRVTSPSPHTPCRSLKYNDEIMNDSGNRIGFVSAATVSEECRKAENNRTQCGVNQIKSALPSSSVLFIHEKDKDKAWKRSSGLIGWLAHSLCWTGTGLHPRMCLCVDRDSAGSIMSQRQTFIS